MAEAEPVTDREQQMARRCLQCPVCAHARRKQGGLVYWFVTKIESRFCPYCQAYEKVYGRKAHELPPSGTK
jgi:hypothetical protein